MALNSYKVHIFAQNKAKKITKTGRGPLYFGQLMLPLHFGAYGCDPLLGPGSIAGGHPVVLGTAVRVEETRVGWGVGGWGG
jgi:hypothetical protein